MIEAVRHIKHMRGGSQPHLVSDADSRLWVVKFANNPQHKRILANEFLASRLAAAIGLTVPICDMIHVSKRLINQTPDFFLQYDGKRVPCLPGLQFGSRYVGQELSEPILDYLDVEQYSMVINRREFAGILAFDKWSGNVDGRQAIFVRNNPTEHHTAVFVDFGYCFHIDEWRFEDVPLRGAFPRNEPYLAISDWTSFEPWLSRLERLDASIVLKLAESIPTEWYGQESENLKYLVRTLLDRRSRIRRLIQDFAESQRSPFPMWAKRKRIR